MNKLSVISEKEKQRALELDIIRQHISMGLEQSERGQFSALSVSDIAAGK